MPKAALAMPRSLHGWANALMLCILTHAAPALAEVSVPTEEVLERAQRLDQSGKHDLARELLRRRVSRAEEPVPLVLAEARSYRREGNPLWAKKTLRKHLDQHPADCSVRLWLVALELEAANLAEAQALLDERTCDEPEELRTRALLLRTWLAELSVSQSELPSLLEQLSASTHRYPEDDRAIEATLARLAPEQRAAVTVSVAAAAGITSDGRSRLPEDYPSSEAPETSGIAATRLSVAFGPNLLPKLEPELSFAFDREQFFGSEERAPDLTRPGVGLGFSLVPSFGRATFRYDFSELYLAHDPSSAFFGERFERRHLLRSRFAFTDGLATQATLAYRTLERASVLDSRLGLDAVFELADKVVLLVDTEFETSFSDDRNLAKLAGQGTLGLSLELPHGFALEQSATLRRALFPSSELAAQEERRDTTTELGAELSGPLVGRLGFTLAAAVSRRLSTRSEFDLDDTRALLGLEFLTDSDRWSVTRVTPEAHVPLEHGTELTQPKDERSLRELVREDRQQKESSSCLR